MEFFQRTGSKDWGFRNRRIRKREDEKGEGHEKKKFMERKE
jgi:hypothetical protein